jgi:hypothetical protein
MQEKQAQEPVAQVEQEYWLSPPKGYSAQSY